MKTPLKSHRHIASMCLRNTLTIGPVEHPNSYKVKILLLLAVLGVLMAFFIGWGLFLGDAILSWGTQPARLSQALYLTLLINRHFSHFLKYSPDRMPRAVLAQRWPPQRNHTIPHDHTSFLHMEAKILILKMTKTLSWESRARAIFGFLAKCRTRPLTAYRLDETQNKISLKIRAGFNPLTLWTSKLKFLSPSEGSGKAQGQVSLCCSVSTN